MHRVLAASDRLDSTRLYATMHAAGAWAIVDGDDDYFSTCLRLFSRIDTEIRSTDEGKFIVPRYKPPFVRHLNRLTSRFASFFDL